MALSSSPANPVHPNLGSLTYLYDVQHQDDGHHHLQRQVSFRGQGGALDVVLKHNVEHGQRQQDVEVPEARDVSGGRVGEREGSKWIGQNRRCWR